jgi:single-stranded DNA-binding protein
MSKNVWEVSGFVGRDPEQKVTSSGKLMSNTSINVYKSKDKAYWVKVVGFGEKSAEVMKVKKSDNIIVEGRHDFDEWEAKDGTKRNTIVIWADKITVLPRREKVVDETTPF